jgi:hypothetical protein
MQGPGQLLQGKAFDLIEGRSKAHQSYHGLRNGLVTSP